LRSDKEAAENLMFQASSKTVQEMPRIVIVVEL